MVDFEKRKEDLVRKIEITKKYKQKLINYVQELKDKKEKGEISEDEFYEKLKSFLKGKSVSEWISYYDECIEVYEKHLKYYRSLSKRKYKPLPQAKKPSKKKPIPAKNILLLFFGLVVFGFMFFMVINNGSLTGFAIQEPISNVKLNSTTGQNITTDNLTCYAQGNDAESSTLDYFAQWKKNGNEFYFNNTYYSSEGDWYYGAGLDSNRNFYIGGYEFNTDEDYKAIKFDKDLNKLNDASFDFGGDDRARGLAVDDEKDYVYLSGYSDVSDKDVKIMMLNSSLDEQWNLTWGGSENDLGYVSSLGPNGYLYTVARTNSYNTTPGQDLAMLKIDSSGNIVWNRSYGDPAGGSISGYGGGVDNKGNAIAMGWWDDGTSYQSKVVKWYENGTKAWDNDYGSDTQTDAPTFMTSDSDNNYVMIAGGGDSWSVWKTYPNGTQIWENYLTNPSGDTCEAEGVVTSSDNKIYVTGYCSSNGNGYALTVAYDSDGNQIWNKTNNETSGVDEGKAIVLDEGENIYVGGLVDGGNGAHAFKFYGSELLNGENGSMNLVGSMNSTYTSVGDNWSCEVSVYDGTSSSDFNESNNLTIINAVPDVDVSQVPNVNPLENGERKVEFFVNVSDADGVGDIDDSSINASFSRTGETTRYNSSCSHIADIDSTTANYSCTIGMWYFDESGEWNITIHSRDTEQDIGINDSESFVYNKLTSFTMSPSSLNWTGLNVNDVNISADNNPVLMNNTGNDVLETINATGNNLIGQNDASKKIYASNFTVNNESVPGGDNLMNSSGISVSNAELSIGNHSVNDNVTGQEQLFFYIEDMNSDLTAQNYSTPESLPWEIWV